MGWTVITTGVRGYDKLKEVAEKYEIRVDLYTPLLKSYVRKANTRKPVLSVARAYPNYVFVRGNILLLRKVPNAKFNYTMMNKMIMTITDKEIEDMKALEAKWSEEHDLRTNAVQKQPSFSVGDRVLIKSGVLQSRVGIVTGQIECHVHVVVEDSGVRFTIHSGFLELLKQGHA